MQFEERDKRHSKSCTREMIFIFFINNAGSAISLRTNSSTMMSKHIITLQCDMRKLPIIEKRKTSNRLATPHL